MNGISANPAALVIDDIASNRELAIALLKMHGTEVDTAPDGASGLAAMRRRKYDLVLLDISMPDVNGQQVCEEIRSDDALRKTYVVAYTAHAFISQQSRMIAAGFDALLIKPITVQSLARAISPVLACRDLAKESHVNP